MSCWQTRSSGHKGLAVGRDHPNTAGVRALVYDAEGLQLVEDHPEPQLGEDEALVHVTCAGICDTDLQLTAGYAGFRGVLGHEFVGRVDAADPLLAGRRVVADINLGCGRCPRCLAEGQGHHCAQRQTLGIRRRDGAFAERVAIPRRNLVPVPEQVEDERAVFAEPLAAALHVLDAVDEQVEADETLVVLGDGKLGLLIALALRAAGRSVCCIGHHGAKLELAARAGVQTRLESELGASDRHRAGFVVEATGNPRGLERALWLVRPRGTVVLKTTTAEPAPVDLAPVVVNELRVVGSRCGDMARAVELLASGALDPRPLICARHPLGSGVAALAAARERGALKVLLRTSS